MKKTTFFKMVLLAVLTIGSSYASAQLLVEDFDYSIGQVLTTTAIADPMSGWLSHSGTGTANIDITAGLTFTGYAGSAIGGAANLDNNGQDINKTFTSQNSGTVYAAFIIQTQSTNSAGYFFMFSPSPVSSTFYSRVYVNATGDGIGISGSSTPSNYISIATGTPVLIVVKCDIASKASSLFVLNSFSATEPANANQTFTESSVSSIGGIALRQYNASQKIIVDGIRVGTSWAEAVAPSYTLPVATPTFSPAPGIFTTSQNISLNTTTPGASIYYTTDGSTPDNSGTGTSTLYTGTPITVNSTTTIKTIAYQNGMTVSNVGKGIFTFPTEITSIGALRAADPSGIYKLTSKAVITYQALNTTGKPRYIQDETAGIMLYDSGSKISGTYNLYDGLTGIIGTLTTFNGMLEFIPFTDPGAATSTGNAITPAIVTVANLGNYSGQLVKVKDVTITGTGNFVVSTAYTITDVTSGKLRTAYPATDLPYIGSAIPTTVQDITGVVLNFSTSEVNLIPRSSADFATAQSNSINETATKINIHASNGNIILSASTNQTVEIFSALGQKLLSLKAVEGMNTIPVSAKGLILVKVGNQISKVIL